jgi:ATP-binding cassette subfamily B protein
MKVKKVWRNFIYFLRLIRKDYPQIIWIICIGALAGAMQPFLQLIVSSRILDLVLSGLYRECTLYVIILLTSTLVLQLIAQACKQSIEVLKDACNDTIYQRTANKAYTMEYDEFEKTETMDAIRRVRGGENGSGGIESQIQSIYILVEQALTIIFSLSFVVLLLFNTNKGGDKFLSSTLPTISIILIFALVLSICIKLSGASYHKFYEMGKTNEHYNSLSMYLISIISNYQYGKDMRIYSMQNLVEKYLGEIMHKINRFYLKWGITDGYYTGFIMLLTQLASGIVYVVIGMNAMNGVISVGDVLLYAGAVLQLTGSIRSEIIEYNQFIYRTEYLNTYYEFINKPSKHYTGTLPIEKRNDSDYEFTLEHVSFQYPGTEDKVLQDINLKFRVGEKFAIVGRNGAGKTTLIKLLCRLYEPTEGRILLNGIDIRYYDYSEYTKIFSVVFQDFKLLSLPLVDNVCSGTEMEEDRIWKVLDQIGIKQRVMEMSFGLHSQLYKSNGDGIEISGGEAQKLAIARGLYKDGPFVILDEPTAALDPLAEAEIYEHFNEMVQGKTAIYISHRMSSCKFCDDIIVLEQGRITERGNHSVLMKQNGVYANLYNTQAQYYAS